LPERSVLLLCEALVRLIDIVFNFLKLEDLACIFFGGPFGTVLFLDAALFVLLYFEIFEQPRIGFKLCLKLFELGFLFKKPFIAHGLLQFAIFKLSSLPFYPLAVAIVLCFRRSQLFCNFLPLFSVDFLRFLGFRFVELVLFSFEFPYFLLKSYQISLLLFELLFSFSGSAIDLFHLISMSFDLFFVIFQSLSNFSIIDLFTQN
jgi:hypothetical protein